MTQSDDSAPPIPQNERYALSRKDLEHSCCYTVALVDRMSRYPSRVGEFDDEDLAARVAELLNRHGNTRPIEVELQAILPDPNWRNCSDGLPKVSVEHHDPRILNSCRVLVATAEGEVQVAMLFAPKTAEDDSAVGLVWIGDDGDEVELVTHWQPLPAPPPRLTPLP